MKNQQLITPNMKTCVCAGCGTDFANIKDDKQMDYLEKALHRRKCCRKFIAGVILTLLNYCEGCPYSKECDRETCFFEDPDFFKPSQD